jgi:asparagine synthase (glutamine-hydrolysing)
MCGIVAAMRFDGRRIDPRDLESMCDTMHHRGPDGTGSYVDGGVGLAVRRLAIIDLTAAGHQPMSNEDGAVWVAFNGEIYNYVELRSELATRGHQFSSHTDTEVIVHLYEELGERCVDRLRGMFAFVIWDKRRQVLFGARDRMGMKPFHYYVDGNQFLCASEIKAILAAPGVPRAVSRPAIADYLFSEFPLGERSMFEGIRQLPPGYAITVSRDGTQIRKYWDVEFAYNTSRSDSAVCSQLGELLDDSVRVHCRSDAELGCHLSGGLDSSIVTGLAARHRKSLKTFSIRFGEGGWYDETAFARTMADFVRAEYLEAVPNGRDFAHLLPGLVWHMEMPLPNLGGFSYYTVSRLAANYSKVALTGHGGDEVFAGYAAQFQTAFGRNPFQNGTHAVGATFDGTDAAGKRATAMTLFGRFARMGFSGLGQRLRNRFRLRPRTSEQLWMALHTSHIPRRNPLVSRVFVSALGDYSPVDDYLAPFRTAPTSELLDRCLYHDLRSYLPILLHMEDRMSMSVSVESRAPLLDHLIVEFMATVPPRQKVPGMKPKGLLRAAATGSIPEIIRKRRDKRPFPVPFDHWAGGILNDISREVLLSPQSLDRGIINPDRLRRWDLTNQELWSALNLELWFQIFIDNDPVWMEQAKVLRSFQAIGI